MKLLLLIALLWFNVLLWTGHMFRVLLPHRLPENDLTSEQLDLIRLHVNTRRGM